MNKKIEFDWNKTLFVHASEEGIDQLKRLLRNYSEIGRKGQSGGLLIWQMEGDDTLLLDEVKERIKQEGFFVEEKKFSEREVSCAELVALLEPYPKPCLRCPRSITECLKRNALLIDSKFQ